MVNGKLKREEEEEQVAMERGEEMLHLFTTLTFLCQDVSPQDSSVNYSNVLNRKCFYLCISFL